MSGVSFLWRFLELDLGLLDYFLDLFLDFDHGLCYLVGPSPDLSTLLLLEVGFEDRKRVESRQDSWLLPEVVVKIGALCQLLRIQL